MKGPVFEIDSARKRKINPGAPPEPSAPVGKNPNQYTRRSFLLMAVAGSSFRAIVKTHKREGATEGNVMAELREAVILSGAAERKAA